MAGNDGACFHVERGNAWRVVLWPAPCGVWRYALHVLDECLRAHGIYLPLEKRRLAQK